MMNLSESTRRLSIVLGTLALAGALGGCEAGRAVGDGVVTTTNAATGVAGAAVGGAGQVAGAAVNTSGQVVRGTARAVTPRY